MPVYPVERLPITARGVFPHMAKHDATIWTRFLDTYADAFESFAYDVALGGQRAGEDQAPEATRLGWQYATALKVDVVGFQPERAWVIEVKPGAGTNALGATLCYVELAAVDRFTDLELVPVVVTDRMSPDVKFCAEQLGVLVFELPPPPPAFTRIAEGGAAERARREGLAG